MGAKVLIIDDDQDFRASVRALLETKGYSVVEAESGKEGLGKLVEEKPDVILLDIMLECCCEGYGVNQAIKWRDEYEPYRNIPVVMVSSIQQSPDDLFPMASELEMIRPDRYVTKPLDIPKFLAVLKTLVAHGMRPAAA